MFLGTETLEDHSQLLKRLTNAVFRWLQAFRMYGGIGMSVPSLHRESTYSLITSTDIILLSKPCCAILYKLTMCIGSVILFYSSLCVGCL